MVAARGVYRADDGADIRIAGGVTTLAYTRDGEWVRYTLDIAEAALYDLQVRYARGIGGNAQLQLLIDGNPVTSVVSLPSTGSWDSYLDATVSDVALPAGAHTLEIQFPVGSANYDYIIFTPSPTTFTSVATQDGHVIADYNNPSSSFEGIQVVDTGVIQIGDTGGNNNNQVEPQVGIISFDTSSLPDNAIVTGATLRLQRNYAVDGLGGIFVDVAPPAGFGGNLALETGDYNAPAAAISVTNLPFPASDGNWSVGNLDAAGLTAINLTGTTQFRIYFSPQYNTDGNEDSLAFSDGSSTTPPELIVTYTFP